MSLRGRLTLVAAGVVAAVVAMASTSTYFLMRHELYAQVDTALKKHAADPQANFAGFNEFAQDYLAFFAPDGSRTGGAHIPEDRAIHAVAAGITAWFVSAAALAPVRRLTAAAELIAETGEPSERVPEGGKGELARLGASFNTMLASLEESLETQRRCVADASHVLRTPLTSLQAYIAVLRGSGELGPAQRR